MFYLMAIMSGRRALKGSRVALLCAFQAVTSFRITVLTALQKHALPFFPLSSFCHSRFYIQVFIETGNKRLSAERKERCNQIEVLSRSSCEPSDELRLERRRAAICCVAAATPGLICIYFFLLPRVNYPAHPAHSSGFPSSFTCRLQFAATDQWSFAQCSAQPCQLSGRTWRWDGGRTGNRRMSHAPSVHFVCILRFCFKETPLFNG